MNQTEVLHKIHEDLELLKRDISAIKEVITLEPELCEEVIIQLQEARKRIANGKFVSNNDILKEFGWVWATKLFGMKKHEII